MDGLVCDRCGEGLLLESDVRYVVRIEVFAAYDPLELSREDLDRDHAGEMKALLERMKTMSADDLQSQVYRKFQYDLCPSCQRVYLGDPMRGGATTP